MHELRKDISLVCYQRIHIKFIEKRFLLVTDTIFPLYVFSLFSIFIFFHIGSTGIFRRFLIICGVITSKLPTPRKKKRTRRDCSCLRQRRRNKSELPACVYGGGSLSQRISFCSSLPWSPTTRIFRPCWRKQWLCNFAWPKCRGQGPSPWLMIPCLIH